MGYQSLQIENHLIRFYVLKILLFVKRARDFLFRYNAAFKILEILHFDYQDMK